MMNGNNPAGAWVSLANWGWNDKGESCSYLTPGSCDGHNWGGRSDSGSHVDSHLKSPGPPAPGPTPSPSPMSTPTPAPTPPSPTPAPTPTPSPAPDVTSGSVSTPTPAPTPLQDLRGLLHRALLWCRG